MPFTDRDTFMALLKRLEGENDQDVIAAAREITQRMKEGGMTWEDLLVPAEGTASAAPDDAGDAPVGPPPADDDTDEKGLDQAAASEELTMIRAMLALDNISDSTRSDLQDFAEDIAQGRFRPADGRYVRALHKRLIG